MAIVPHGDSFFFIYCISHIYLHIFFVCHIYIFQVCSLQSQVNLETFALHSLVVIILKLDHMGLKNFDTFNNVA